VDVNQGNIQPLPIAIMDFVAASPGDVATSQNIAKIVRADLDRSGLFKPLDPKSFIDKVTDINVVPNFANWRIITAQGLVTGSAATQPDGRLRRRFSPVGCLRRKPDAGSALLRPALGLAAHRPQDLGCSL